MRTKFSKVSALEHLLYKATEERTFENVYTRALYQRFLRRPQHGHAKKKEPLPKSTLSAIPPAPTTRPRTCAPALTHTNKKCHFFVFFRDSSRAHKTATHMCTNPDTQKNSKVRVLRCLLYKITIYRTCEIFVLCHAHAHQTLDDYNMYVLVYYNIMH